MAGVTESNSRTLLLSDGHTGSMLAPWPAWHPVEQGGRHKPNKFQRWLWKCWEQAAREIDEFAPEVVLLNGDMIQGSHHRDGQLVTDKLSIQVGAAIETLCVSQHIKDGKGRLYYVRGTEWHDGKAADDVEALARELGAERHPDTDMLTWDELWLSIGGPVFHCTHSIGFSSMPMYELTTPVRDLLVMLTELERTWGRARPNLKGIVRSHRHRYVYANVGDLHAVVTPGWQLKNAYGYKKNAHLQAQIGYVTIENVDGEILVRKKLFPLPRPRIEVV